MTGGEGGRQQGGIKGGAAQGRQGQSALVRTMAGVAAIHAAERANRLVVEEGIPFREAYKRVGAELRADGTDAEEGR